MKRRFRECRGHGLIEKRRLQKERWSQYEGTHVAWVYWAWVLGLTIHLTQRDSTLAHSSMSAPRDYMGSHPKECTEKMHRSEDGDENVHELILMRMHQSFHPHVPPRLFPRSITLVLSFTSNCLQLAVMLCLHLSNIQYLTQVFHLLNLAHIKIHWNQP